ncbi:hypothetical protein [Rubrivirga sp. IMCC45206]|uniref:hypothetical protein n=1 Tax=Rubrivirga sp. IMCC45206 TaxID=3391614 RepID=UPI0039900483
MRLLLLVSALAASACAQAPAEAADPGRRADSVVTRPDAAEIPGDGPTLSDGDVTTGSRDTLAVTDIRIPLGDGAIVARVSTAPITDRLASPGFEAVPLNALNLHDDESTSVEAALAVVRELGGRVVELRHSGERNLTFAVGGATFRADPNRVFTDAGRRRTLASLSAATPAALAALEAFADSALAVYAAVPAGVVLTLHNNTDDNYSARSYAPGGEYASDAAAVTVHPGTDPDDFFFVTDRALYDALAEAGFNAVLQDNDAATDDGSLSVWAARRGVPYVNVEAQHGHVEAQAQMIRALVGVLSRQ